MDSEKKIFKLISNILEIPENLLSEDTAIGDFPKWDSINQLLIISELENEFNIKLDPEDIMEMEDISDIIDIIEEYTSK